MNMPMLMAMKPTQAFTPTEPSGARIAVTPRIFSSRLCASARRQNPLLNPNASSDQHQVERREGHRDRDRAKGEGQHCDLCDHQEVIGVPEIAVWPGSHERCVRQGDNAGCPKAAQARDYFAQIMDQLGFSGSHIAGLPTKSEVRWMALRLTVGALTAALVAPLLIQ